LINLNEDKFRVIEQLLSSSFAVCHLTAIFPSLNYIMHGFYNALLNCSKGTFLEKNNCHSKPFNYWTRKHSSTI